jgi:hypothetical protein
LLVHIGDPSSNQATTLESQMIHMIQELFGQTLRKKWRVWKLRLQVRQRLLRPIRKFGPSRVAGQDPTPDTHDAQYPAFELRAADVLPDHATFQSQLKAVD